MESPLTVDQLKYTIKWFGQTPKGKKKELTSQLSVYLETLTYTQLKERCPSLVKKSKAEFIVNIMSNPLPPPQEQLPSPTTDSSSSSSSSLPSLPILPEVKSRVTTNNKKIRMDVWNKWIGKQHGIYNCLLCETQEIQQGSSNGWDCSHVIPHCRGGKVTIDNLRPLCKGCNSSMGTMDMTMYCDSYPGSLKRLSLESQPLHEEEKKEDSLELITNRMEDITMSDVPKSPDVTSQPSISTSAISMEDIPQPTVTDVIDTIKFNLEEQIKSNYTDFRNQLERFRGSSPLLYRIFEPYIKIGDINLKMFEMKPMWKEYVTEIKKQTFCCHQHLQSYMINAYSSLKSMVDLSLQLTAHCGGKKTYKWKSGDVTEVSPVLYTRSEKFGYGSYCGSQNEYGQKHWEKLGKLSVPDLWRISQIQNKNIKDTPEKLLK